MITVMVTEITVTTSSSIESAQKPKAPKERNERQTSSAIRQLATAYPIHVAIATTPSHPMIGAGRGGVGTAISAAKKS